MDSRVAAILSFIHLSCVSVQSLLPRNLLYGHRLRSNIALHLVRPSSFQFELYKKKSLYVLLRVAPAHWVFWSHLVRVCAPLPFFGCSSLRNFIRRVIPAEAICGSRGCVVYTGIALEAGATFRRRSVYFPPGFRWSCRSFQGYPQSCVTCFDPRGASSLPAVRS